MTRDETMTTYFEQEMILEDALHRHREEVTQFEPTLVSIHLTFLHRITVVSHGKLTTSDRTSADNTGTQHQSEVNLNQSVCSPLVLVFTQVSFST